MQAEMSDNDLALAWESFAEELRLVPARRMERYLSYSSLAHYANAAEMKNHSAEENYNRAMMAAPSWSHSGAGLYGYAGLLPRWP